MKVKCPNCKKEIIVDEEDFIDIGRQQVLNEINNLLLRLRE